MSTKTKRIIGWVITGLVSAMMLMSAFMKFKGGPEMEGGPIPPATMRIIGMVELLSVVFWLIPRTGVIGALLLCGYLGGAIYVHLSMADFGGMMTPVGISAAVWIASALRMPELVRRLAGKPELS